MQYEAMAQGSGVIVPAWRFLLAGKPCSLCIGLIRRTCHQHVWVLLQVLRCCFEVLLQVLWVLLQVHQLEVLLLVHQLEVELFDDGAWNQKKQNYCVNFL